ncbi:MAG: ATP-binding protein [Bacteroidota bacterium]
MDVFLDEDGKLWLSICGSASSAGIDLYQFDGYEFSLVQGAFNILKGTTTISGLLQGHILFGFSNIPDGDETFFYDLHTNELSIPESNIVGHIRKMHQTSTGEVRVVSEIEGFFQIYEWKQDEWERINQIPIETQDTMPQTGELRSLICSIAEEERYWFYVSKGQYFQSMHATDGLGQRLYPTNFEINPEAVIGKTKKLRTVQGDTYFYHRARDVALPFLLLDQGDNHFKKLPWAPATWWGRHIAIDQQGNRLFIFQDERGITRAVLEAPDKTRYDYSAFFKDIAASTIREVRGPNFKELLLMVGEHGFQLHLVKDETAIITALKGHSIRAMLDLSEDEILVSNQGRTLFVFNKRSSATRPWIGQRSDRGFFYLREEHKGRILSSATNGFYLSDSTREKEELIPTISVRVGPWVPLNDHQIVFRGDENYLYLLDRRTKLSERLIIQGGTGAFRFGDQLNKLHYSREEILWAATSNGLLKIDLKSSSVDTIGLGPPFLDSRFMCMEEDEQGRLWLGTYLGGLHIYDPETGTLKTLNSQQGLANNTVVSITTDDQGDRWLGTYNGVSLVSSNGDLIRNIYETDGLINRECNRYSNLKAHDGTILIGTIDGLNIIDPLKVKQQLRRNEALKIYLTSISYYHSSIGRDSLREYQLNALETIQLPASKRNLSLRFATSNYVNAAENQYAYMLEGIDENWIKLGTQARLDLNNLPAGKYRLLIKGSDGLGNWTKDPLGISIHAREHFYRQSWFYILIVLLLGGLAGLWISRLRSLVKTATQKIAKDKAVIEQQAEELKELDQSKSRFFTNISHEFRTPLTIISGMANQIEQQPKQWAQKGAKMIKRNSNNLLRLINQILDLRQLESSAMEVQYIQGDVVEFLRYISESFEPYTNSKGVSLHFLSAISVLVMDYDPDKLMKVTANLLSNAIKYTPDGKDIYLHLDQKMAGERQLLQIRVEDTGAGIPEDQLPLIFDRFFKADQELTSPKPGSGIGLALTKELIELLGGEIHVNSSVNKGTTFTILLPVTNTAPIESSGILEEDNSNEELASLAYPADWLRQSETQMNSVSFLSDSKQPKAETTILIAEDNKDVQEYLRSCLEDLYKIEVAENGAIGIDQAFQTIPDIVITDLLMPEKNGYELTNALKADERTNHIPIIMLTSSVDLSSKITGLEQGADVYLTKPFTPQEIRLQLRNLLEMRRKLQEKYAFTPENTPNIRKQEAPLNPFLQKFVALIEKHLSDTDYGMPQISRALAMSRSQIFRKIKALTGHAPTDYIRNFRLHKGRELLLNTDLTISEIAYDVGFSSLSYFSRAFSDVYGISPGSLRK